MDSSSPLQSGLSYSELSSLPGYFEAVASRFTLFPMALALHEDRVFIFSPYGAQMCHACIPQEEFFEWVAKANAFRAKQREETLARQREAQSAKRPRGEPAPMPSSTVPDIDFDL